ncbi:glycosyltransferase [Cytophagaceae bacterium DM2B3-1]|uniref:Glycosyltransferase n=1 Tax=Xanthocytophaga flava TaxID=3048013 RepID=A0ABT7CDL2_9BACT|nr:glycosyltransferase [Xanthocytophaga flavus]MDJ1491712.1 glycosyltransferase [Xanthocytophaga flavus]
MLTTSNDPSAFPKISVITPSYNQGQYIEETIQSVLGQYYPNLEYIILDAGSTDNTVSIIKKYESQISYWHSKKDNGQASAINEGLNMATGDILCWLNSDDMFMPGTLHFIAKQLNINKKELVFGNCCHMTENTHTMIGSDVVLWASYRDLKCYDYIIQPSSFWTRKLWEATGPLNESLHYVLDWDWYIRAQKASDKFTAVERYLSIYRIHPLHKTGSKDTRRYEEFKWIYKTYLNEKIVQYFISLVENKSLNRLTKKLINKKRVLWYKRFVTLTRRGMPNNQLRDIAEVVRYNF